MSEELGVLECLIPGVANDRLKPKFLIHQADTVVSVAGPHDLVIGVALITDCIRNSLNPYRFPQYEGCKQKKVPRIQNVIQATLLVISVYDHAAMKVAAALAKKSTLKHQKHVVIGQKPRLG